IYPQISGNGGFPLQPFAWKALRTRGIDVLFLATPHEVSREWVPEALRHGVRVVDLSGAWRLLQRESRAIYDFHDADPDLAEEITAQAVYGIPELHRERLKTTTLVANAGCYSTSIILALAPLLRSGLVDLDH